jgi:hypothetical protein
MPSMVYSQYPGGTGACRNATDGWAIPEDPATTFKFAEFNYFLVELSEDEQDENDLNGRHNSY